MWILFIFRSSKIHVSSTDDVSSISPPRCRLSSDRHRHATTLCHTSFPWSQDDLAAFASFFGNASFRDFSFQVKIEALNPHHRCRPPSPDSLTPTLYCYKKIILTLITLHITQPRLHFIYFIARPPHHQSFTHRHCSL
jgi:hypothetical protein